MKWVLILYTCSMLTNDCPSSSISGFQFNSHYDCVEAGYKMAYNKFKHLETLEEFDKEYIEEKKLVIKFECRGIETKNI